MAASRWRLMGLASGALVLLILLGRRGLMATLIFGTFIPLPLLLVGWRLGLGQAVFLAGAAASFVLVFHPSWSALLEHAGLWALLLLGLFLAFGYHRHWAYGSAIMVATLALGLVSLVHFGLQAYLGGQRPWILWQQKSQEVVTALAATLRPLGLELEDLRLFQVAPGELPVFLQRILPALALSNTALVAWLNVLVGVKVAETWGWKLEAEPLRHWSCPEWLVFLLVAAGFALLAPPPWVRTLGLNLLLVLALAYFFQGLAVIATLLRRYQAPGIIRFPVYFVSFVHPVSIMVMLLGLADLWLDFRRLQPPREA